MVGLLPGIPGVFTDFTLSTFFFIGREGFYYYYFCFVFICAGNLGYGVDCIVMFMLFRYMFLVFNFRNLF